MATIQGVAFNQANVVIACPCLADKKQGIDKHWPNDIVITLLASCSRYGKKNTNCYDINMVND